MLLYIDPGTGSMLFTVLIGIFSACVYFIRLLFLKLKFAVGGRGNTAEKDSDKLPIVIFSDHKRYWSIFEPVCDEFENRKQKVLFLTGSEDDPCFNRDYSCIERRYIGSGNRGFALLNTLNASVVLATTPSLDVFQWKRSKSVDHYIHILHAVGGLTTYRMFALDHYDSILISVKKQEEFVRKLEDIRNLPAKDLYYVGIPYMDRMAARVQNSEKKSSDNITVLLAPSWGESSLLSKCGEQLIAALISTGYRIVIRPHPQSLISEKEMLSSLRSRFPESGLLQWNSDNDNFAVMNESDILISDYSGITFEYALAFDKPVIYNLGEYDPAPYDYWWVDEKPWTFEMLPRIGKELKPEEIPEIKDVINDCIYNEEYRISRDDARNEMWPFRGDGAKSVVDRVMEIYDKVTKGEKKDAGRNTRCGNGKASERADEG